MNSKSLLRFGTLSLVLVAISAVLFPLTQSSAAPANSYSVTMTKPYQPSATAGGYDDYRCFLLDPKISTDSFLTSIDFQPMVKPLVHHAILYRIDARDVAEATALDTKGAGWNCFGGPGVGGGNGSFLGAPWLSEWAPGRGVDNVPAGFGVPYGKGSKIVLQVHYNLLAATNGNVLPDQSKITITAVKQSLSKLKPLTINLLPAPVEMACPSGVTGDLCDRKKSLQDLANRTSANSAMQAMGINYLCGKSALAPTPSTTSTCDHQMNQAFSIIEAGPHMHLLGKSLKIVLNPDSKSPVTILDKAVYNFDEQGPTVLKAPIAVKVGDVVRITCTFDPTLRAILPQTKKLPPRYITWGEGSSDEMCLGVLMVSASNSQLAK